MDAINRLTHELYDSEQQLLARLRRLRRDGRASHAEGEAPAPELTAGQKIADQVASTMGSWNFIIIQSGILVVWIILNVTAYVQQWDPYPFILLNLFLSMLAAIQAPVIMMSQNRQDKKDRLRSELDFDVNRRAEAEIQNLSRKLNLVTDKLGDVDDFLRDVVKHPAESKPNS